MPQWTLHLQPTQTGVTFKVRSQSKGTNFNRLSKFWKDNQSLFIFLLVLFLSHLWYPKSTQYCWYTSLNRVCGFGKIMLKNKIKGIEGFNLSTITHAWRSQKNYENKMIICAHYISLRPDRDVWAGNEGAVNCNCQLVLSLVAHVLGDVQLLKSGRRHIKTKIWSNWQLTAQLAGVCFLRGTSRSLFYTQWLLLQTHVVLCDTNSVSAEETRNVGPFT